MGRQGKNEGDKSGTVIREAGLLSFRSGRAGERDAALLQTRRMCLEKQDTSTGMH